MDSPKPFVLPDMRDRLNGKPIEDDGMTPEEREKLMSSIANAMKNIKCGACDVKLRSNREGCLNCFMYHLPEPLKKQPYIFIRTIIKADGELPGQVHHWNGENIPTGWLHADGSKRLKKEYPELAAVCEPYQFVPTRWDWIKAVWSQEMRTKILETVEYFYLPDFRYEEPIGLDEIDPHVLQ